MILFFLVGYEGYTLCLTHARCLRHILLLYVFRNYLHLFLLSFFSGYGNRPSQTLPIRCPANIAEGGSSSILWRILTKIILFLLDFLKRLQAAAWGWVWSVREIPIEIVFVNFLHWFCKLIGHHRAASLIKLWDYIGLGSTLISQAAEFFANLICILHILNLIKLLRLLFLLLQPQLMLEELLLDLTWGVRCRDEWIARYTRGMNRHWASTSHHVSPTCSTLCFLFYAAEGESVSWFKELLGNRSRSPLQISLTSSRCVRKLLATILIRLDLHADLSMLEGIFDIIACALVLCLLLFSHLALHGECVRDLFQCNFSWPIHLDTKK